MTPCSAKVDGLKGYHDVTRYPAARRVPGLVLFRPTVGSAVDAYVAETGVAWREEDVEPNADPEGR